MVSEFDTASLPAEAQAELARLADIISQDASTEEDETPQDDDNANADTGDRAGKSSADPQVSATLSALLDQQKATNELIKTLTDSNRTLQGQVRTFESRLNQPRVVEPVVDDLADVDDSDPAIAALIKRDREKDARIARLEASLSATQVSAQEQAQRDQWFTFLENGIAVDLGVDFTAEIAPQLKGIATASLAEVGAKLITTAAKKAMNGNGHSPSAIASAKEQAKIELLRTLGIYDGDVRGGSANNASAVQQMESLNARLNAGKIEIEDYTAAVKGLQKQL